MKTTTDLEDIVTVLQTFDFVEGEDDIWRSGPVCAIIEGRVVVFNVGGMANEIYGSLYDENFEPQNVMERYQFKIGILPLVDAYLKAQGDAASYEEALETYSEKVAEYFNARGVPVNHKELCVDGRAYCEFRLDDSVLRGRNPETVNLFNISARFDFGMEFEFEGGHSIVAPGENVEAEMLMVFDEDLTNMIPEDPVERVDYSSSYHYRHIVNAIPDMLRVGLVSVCKSTANIVTSLDKPITSCRKHFRPEILGTITDYDVKFKSTIHTDKAWNE